jgi:hypothetical protein
LLTTGLWTSVTTTEDATYTATLVKVPGGPVGTPLTGTAKAYFKPGLHFTGLKLLPGAYQFQIVLKAVTNPSRTTTLTSSTFTVGSPTTVKPGKVKPPTTPLKKCKRGQKLKKGKCVRL